LRLQLLDHRVARGQVRFGLLKRVVTGCHALGSRRAGRPIALECRLNLLDGLLLVELLLLAVHHRVDLAVEAIELHLAVLEERVRRDAGRVDERGPIRHDVSAAVRAGDAFVRRGVQQARLVPVHFPGALHGGSDVRHGFFSVFI
jgi:hypothetical protein